MLDNLAAQLPPEEIVRLYPGLTRMAIDACVVYAAERSAFGSLHRRGTE